MEVIRSGEIVKDSFKMLDNRLRYAYELGSNPKLRLVVDEYNDGKKVFDYYSDRNFVDYKTNEKETERLNKKNIENLAVGSPYPHSNLTKCYLPTAMVQKHIP